MRYLIFFFLAASFAANAQTAAELLSGQDFLGFNTQPVSYMIRNYSANPVNEYASLTNKSGLLVANTGYLQSKFALQDATVANTAAGELTISLTNQYNDKLKVVLVMREDNWQLSYVRLVQAGGRHTRTWLEWYNE